MHSYIYIICVCVNVCNSYFLAILLILNKDHKTKNAIHTHILHNDAGHGTQNPKFCKRLSFAFPANTFWKHMLMRDVSSHHASTNSCPSQCCVALPGLWQHQVASSLRVACKHQWSAENTSVERWFCDLYIVFFLYLPIMYISTGQQSTDVYIFIMFCSQYPSWPHQRLINYVKYGWWNESTSQSAEMLDGGSSSHFRPDLALTNRKTWEELRVVQVVLINSEDQTDDIPDISSMYCMTKIFQASVFETWDMDGAGIGRTPFSFCQEGYGTPSGSTQSVAVTQARSHCSGWPLENRKFRFFFSLDGS